MNALQYVSGEQAAEPQEFNTKEWVARTPHEALMDAQSGL